MVRSEVCWVLRPSNWRSHVNAIECDKRYWFTDEGSAGLVFESRVSSSLRWFASPGLANEMDESSTSTRSSLVFRWRLSHSFFESLSVITQYNDHPLQKGFLHWTYHWGWDTWCQLAHSWLIYFQAPRSVFRIKLNRNLPSVIISS